MVGRAERRSNADALAALLTSTLGGQKDATQAARAAVLINKVESPSEWDAARRTARAILFESVSESSVESGVERVVIGALAGKAASDWEVWSP